MKKLSLVLGCVAVSVFAIGCEQGNTKTAAPTAMPAKTPLDEHEGHDHAAVDHTAPHGGHLIELGRNHEYHAELLDDHKTESVIIYMMDADMKPLSIDSSAVSLVLSAGEKTETFELLASQPGGSSEFKSNDANMMELIEAEKVSGKLRVTIDDKPFTGSFDHLEHGHEGDAGSHEGHDH